MKTLTILGALVLGAGALAQDAPVEIPKGDLPKRGICAICKEGEEAIRAGFRYKGKSYLLCNVKEVEPYRADPDAYVEAVLPRPAGALPFTTLEGTKKSLADYKGKLVLVDFWATWCAPCVKSMPDLQKLHAKLADRGFAVLGVSVDEEGAKKVKPFIEKRKFTYPILLDESGGWKKWGVKGIPAMFLVDRNGQIVRQWSGAASHKELEKAITELLK